MYEYVIKHHDVLGGKIIGAGGGGFLMLYTPKNHYQLDQFMYKNGYQRLNYDVDWEGSKLLYADFM